MMEERETLEGTDGSKGGWDCEPCILQEDNDCDDANDDRNELCFGIMMLLEERREQERGY
jgi:hypothetical protein